MRYGASADDGPSTSGVGDASPIEPRETQQVNRWETEKKVPNGARPSPFHRLVILRVSELLPPEPTMSISTHSLCLN